MKYAYLFSGQPTFYPDILNYYDNYQISLDDRVCSHLWWDNSYYDKIYKFWFIDKYREKNLDKKFIETYKVTDYVVERHKNFDLNFVKKINFELWKGETIEHYKIVTPIIFYSLLSQTYSNYQAFLQTKKYKDIDIIIKSRPDVLMTKPIKEVISTIDIKENVIYFQSSMNGGHLYAGENPNNPCDWFFMGTPNVMEKYCYEWYNSIKFEQKTGLIHHFEYLQTICKKSNLKIELIDFGAIIYKQATDWYKKYKIDPKFYINNFDYESCKPLKIDMWPHWISDVNFNHFKQLV